MSDNSISHLCKKIQDGPARFVVNWVYDYDSSMFEEGEYTSDEGEWTVDRERGYLLGERVYDARKKFDNEDKASVWEDEHPEYEVSHYEMSQQVADKFYAEHGYHNFYVGEDLAGDEVTVFYSGYEVLARDLRRTYRHNDYRYFKPPVGNYLGVPKDELIKYCIQDYERAEALNRGEWGYTGCIVTMYVDGLEVASHSVWGIPSDEDKSELEATEQDLIAECKSEAKTKAAALRDAANKLDEYLDQPEEEEYYCHFCQQLFSSDDVNPLCPECGHSHLEVPED
jgi:hypothetical protein